MRFENPAHPGRAVRLGYCMNLHPGETEAEVRAGIEAIALPLRDRLANGSPFGVGAYLAAALADGFEGPDAARFGAWLAEEGLDPFTFNAFPFGGFHTAGLKERVFHPTWAEPARLDYTTDVARVAAQWSGGSDDRHVSISTHTGGYGAWIRGDADLDAYGAGLGRAVARLAALEASGGPRVVLSLEPEPRSAAGTCAELRERLATYRGAAARVLGGEGGVAPDAAAALLARHLGVCLDTCHAAVEFEDPAQAVADATADGTPIGKLQLSSALRLADPDGDADGRAALLGLDENVYLHQVTGRRADGSLARAGDLREVGPDLDGCEEWRCHFHVPVDLPALPGAGGLATTRDHASAVLAEVLSAPERWGTTELHVEIETYTWSILPGPARTAEDLVEGLAAEYAHATRELAKAGWERR